MEKTTWDTPLANPRHERYCQARVAGKTQRQAMLEAWPDRTRWKPETVDNKACKLEADREVKARIAALKRAAAERAITTRAEVLAGMSEAFEAGIERIRTAPANRQLSYTAVTAVTSLGKTLLDALPEEKTEERGEFTRDFALLIGRDFFRPHMLIARGEQTEFWCRGGRGSLKSSWASIELVNHIETHPGEHAAAVMKRKNSLRDAVYAQVVWAIHEMGLDDEYEMLRRVRRPAQDQGPQAPVRVHRLPVVRGVRPVQGDGRDTNCAPVRRARRRAHHRRVHVQPAEDA